MIRSGWRGWRILQHAVLAVWLVLTGAAAAAAVDWNLDDLMQLLASTHSGHARFVEEKHISLLDAPLKTTGELFYRAPDHLERRTLTPKAEDMTVDGDALHIQRDGQDFHVRLSDYPELAAFIESIRGTLAGDRGTLEQHYHLSLEGDRANWVLQLLPREEAMQQVVWRIRIAGQQGDVHSVEITQPDGDSSLMRIEPLDTP